MLEIIDTLTQIVVLLGTLIVEVGALVLRNALLIVWVAWWLCGCNWKKAWPVLAQGGWTVVVLLTVLTALVWSAVAPSTYLVFGLFELATFWWQLGAVTALVLLALFCGWLQGVFGWTPAEIDLEPPTPSHEHAHH